MATDLVIGSPIDPLSDLPIQMLALRGSHRDVVRERAEQSLAFAHPADRSGMPGVDSLGARPRAAAGSRIIISGTPIP